MPVHQVVKAKETALQECPLEGNTHVMAEEANPEEQAVVETPAVDDSPEAGVEALRQQMAHMEEARNTAEKERDEARRSGESERAAREEAERRANHSAAEAHNRAQTAWDAQYDSVINAHAAAQAELTQAKNSLKTAMAEGDFDKVAELSADIGISASKLRQFEEGKAALEAQRKNATSPSASPPYTSESDQRESFIRSKTARTASWLRRNDRYFNDSSFRNAVGGAHNLAVHRGISLDSDEYFRFIEEQTGLTQPEHTAAATVTHPAASTAATTTARQSPTPAAPAAGSTASAARPSAGGNTVTLSAAEREVCRISGITEAAYAKQKQALIAEGSIGTGH